MYAIFYSYHIRSSFISHLLLQFAPAVFCRMQQHTHLSCFVLFVFICTYYLIVIASICMSSVVLKLIIHQFIMIIIQHASQYSELSTIQHAQQLNGSEGDRLLKECERILRGNRCNRSKNRSKATTTKLVVGRGWL